MIFLLGLLTYVLGAGIVAGAIRILVDQYDFPEPDELIVMLVGAWPATIVGFLGYLVGRITYYLGLRLINKFTKEKKNAVSSITK